MFTQGTQNYGLPQWLPQEKPTWLGDMNSAFLSIDTNLKSVSDTALLAQNSAVQAQAKIGIIDFSQIASTLSGAVVELATRISNILTRIGNDNISQLGTSITNAIVNIGANVSTLTSSVNNILTRLGNVVITEVGTSITNAIVNLNNKFNIVIYENEAINYTDIQNFIGYLYNRTLIINIFLKKNIPTEKIIRLTELRMGVMNKDGLLRIDGTNFVNITLATFLQKGTVQITNQNTHILAQIVFNEGVTITDANNVAIPNFTTINGTIDRLGIEIT